MRSELYSEQEMSCLDHTVLLCWMVRCVSTMARNTRFTTSWSVQDMAEEDLPLRITGARPATPTPDHIRNAVADVQDPNEPEITPLSTPSPELQQPQDLRV